MKVPSWFQRAIGLQPEDHTVDVDGVAIHYLRWGPRRTPGIVFIHGGAAHAHWWSHLAPMLLDSHAVAAIDLSGHGDSGRRNEYSLATWVSEVVAVIQDAEFSTPPVVVGHSMGGFVALATAAMSADSVGGIIVVDSPVREVDPEVDAGQRGREFKSPKTYDSVDTAVARFRTVPAQRNYLPYVMDWVGRHSLKPVEGGFSWKFDPNVFAHGREGRGDLLSTVECRVALLRAQYGLVTPEIGEYMYDRLGRVAPVIELPSAGHHPMLDVPLILLTALRSLLADWEHSTPYRRD